MKKIAAIILILISIIMLFIGIWNQILPPVLTGLGFIPIAMVFLSEKNQVQR